MIQKRSVVIAGHSTSITLEDAFWKALHSIAEERDTTLRALIAEIDAQRDDKNNLSSAIRLFVLGYYQRRCAHQSL